MQASPTSECSTRSWWLDVAHPAETGRATKVQVARRAGGTRTPNLLIRSQVLYPIGLRAHRRDRERTAVLDGPFEVSPVGHSTQGLVTPNCPGVGSSTIAIPAPGGQSGSGSGRLSTGKQPLPRA